MARFIRDKNNWLFDRDFYGDKTWGLNSQDSIEQRGENEYYFHFWTAGNMHFDDHTEEVKIEVIKASDNIEDVVDEIKDTPVGKLAFIEGRVVAVLKTFKPDEYLYPRGTDWLVFEPEFFYSKNIHVRYINKIKNCQLKIFEAEDDDFVDRRVVRANERAIEHWLDKAGIKDKILRYELLENIEWHNDNCCKVLEKSWWRIQHEKVSRLII